MKETAVEWLIHQLIIQNEVTLKGENYKLFEIAKAMHEEQIIDAVESICINEKTGEFLNGKEYYNETYKSNQNES